MHNSVEIGKNILILRKTKSLSQEKLAEMADISVTWLRATEHDCANVTRDVLDRLAEALGVSAWALYALQSDPDTVRNELQAIQALIRSARKAALV